MLINVENLPLVAMDFMNVTHFEDVAIINRINEAIEAYIKEKSTKNEQSVSDIYSEWFAHTINHFQTEEKMMQERSFPPYMMHKGEHDRALAQMDAVFRAWQTTKDAESLKKYMQNEMSPWLIQHIQTMDTVTAMFFKSGMSPCSAH
ncbi:MAG: hemerythrin family protein [Sulfurimonadaceae bacterium]|jgi:hemerythrin|nr:hemerythrin family protein [Sulfurimonadaceae bacterium]